MPPSTAPPAPQIPEEYTKPGTTFSARPARRRRAEKQPGDPRVLVLRARGGGRGRHEAVAVLSLRRSRRLPRAPETVGRRRAVHVHPDDLRALGGRDWLLFNFGAREAEVQEATRSLYAADWTHNAAIQDVVLQVAPGVLPVPQREGPGRGAEGEPRRGAEQSGRRRGASSRGGRDDRGRAAGQDGRVAGGARAPGRAGTGADRPRRARHDDRRRRQRARGRRRACPRSCRSTP